MPVIITIMIAMFLILISWTWHNLGNIENSKKIITITILLFIIFVITFVVFNISKSDLIYNKEEEMQAVRTILVILFTIINGLIVMPSIAKTLGKIFESDIDKQTAKMRLIITLAIFVLILIFECGYLKNIQKEILNIYNEALSNIK